MISFVRKRLHFLHRPKHFFLLSCSYPTLRNMSDVNQAEVETTFDLTFLGWITSLMRRRFKVFMIDSDQFVNKLGFKYDSFPAY